ncbi:unnamed protein product, partial [Dibothriocephalus latus]
MLDSGLPVAFFGVLVSMPVAAVAAAVIRRNRCLRPQAVPRACPCWRPLVCSSSPPRLPPPPLLL